MINKNSFLPILCFVIIISLMIVIKVIRFSLCNYKEQKNAIIGQNYRRKTGEYTFDKYVEDHTPIKQNEWLKQKNAGTNPKFYDKEIKYTDHIESFYCLVSKKGF